MVNKYLTVAARDRVYVMIPWRWFLFAIYILSPLNILAMHRIEETRKDLYCDFLIFGHVSYDPIDTICV